LTSKLARIEDKDVALDSKAVSFEEELFVTMPISHLSIVFRVWRLGEFVKLEGLKKDVREFFELPIPKAVWEKSKTFQDGKFVAFVERCLNGRCPQSRIQSRSISVSRTPLVISGDSLRFARTVPDVGGPGIEAFG
jgi:hypothetical protein